MHVEHERRDMNCRETGERHATKCSVLHSVEYTHIFKVLHAFCACPPSSPRGTVAPMHALANTLCDAMHANLVGLCVEGVAPRNGVPSVFIAQDDFVVHTLVALDPHTKRGVSSDVERRVTISRTER